MNSYTLGISGSVLALIFSILIGFGIAYYSYWKPIPPLNTGKRWFLISLRTIAMALLLFILFEPILTRLSSQEIKPKIAIYIDNSLSMAMTDGNGNRSEYLENLINNLNLEEQNDISIYKFDANLEEIENFKFDSLDFSGVETNISRVINYTSDISENQNIIANILISDGAFNKGENPIYSIEKYDRPFFVIGIGDTNVPKDILIRNIISNEIAYINNPIPINVNINSEGFSNITNIVEIYENDIKIDEQTLNLSSDVNSYSVLFEYTPKSEGIKKITTKIKSIEGEITTKNNQKSTFIRVLKSKKKIAIFSGAPNSDFSFFKKEALHDPNVEINEFIQKSGQVFYKTPNKENISGSELLVLIDFPNQYTPNNILNLIKDELISGKPMLFIAGFSTDYGKLRMLEDYLPFKTISTNKQEFLVTADVESFSLSHPLLRIFGNEDDMTLWNELPPIFKTETFVQVKPESDFIAGLKVNNVKLQEPLILSRNFQGKKSIAILGYGLYRWKLMDYASDKSKGNQNSIDMYSYFVNNSIKWLSVDANKKLFTIRAAKNQYTGNEPVEIFAEVYDASYNPIENATIKALIKSDKDQRDVSLIHKGNGRYQVNIEGLLTGDYSISGSAFIGSRQIGKDIDRFSIGNLELEYSTLILNRQLLETIADRSGGNFYYQESQNILNEIRNENTYKSTFVSITNEIVLWNLPWILGIAILLFSIEWFLRKRSGMI